MLLEFTCVPKNKKQEFFRTDICVSDDISGSGGAVHPAVRARDHTQHLPRKMRPVSGQSGWKQARNHGKLNQ